MQPSCSGIYEIIDNSQRCYIGKASNMRSRETNHLSDLRRGKHHSKTLQRVANKYGESSLVFIVLAVCKDKHRLRSAEAALISYFQPFHNTMTATRTGVMEHSAETKIKMTKSLLKQWENGVRSRKHTPEWNAKIAASHKGKKASQEARAAMSVAAKTRHARKREFEK